MQLQSIAAILEYTHIHLYICSMGISRNPKKEGLYHRNHISGVYLITYTLPVDFAYRYLQFGPEDSRGVLDDTCLLGAAWMSQPFDSHPEAKQVDLGMEESH